MTIEMLGKNEKARNQDSITEKKEKSDEKKDTELFCCGSQRCMVDAESRDTTI